MSYVCCNYLCNSLDFVLASCTSTNMDAFFCQLAQYKFQLVAFLLLSGIYLELSAFHTPRTKQFGSAVSMWLVIVVLNQSKKEHKFVEGIAPWSYTLSRMSTLVTEVSSMSRVITLPCFMSKPVIIVTWHVDWSVDWRW